MSIASVDTLVECATGFVALAKMVNATRQEYRRQHRQCALNSEPVVMCKTMTCYQGCEMLTERTGVRTDFADPHAPWEQGATRTPRGCCTSTPPKSIDLSICFPDESNAILLSLNSRSRTKLEFE
ncbi:hypothetical protein [Janthinobacterium sp. SUN120]|uniref:hypothetical protein n=1 Tax=Janthinobacterium sp. SUN120 TaxID=3004099 RepID=UPI0025B0A6AB|nr:hypothetical protein [Janthinobacterium sp. SUN120]MDN2716640.1 hypothetical protein [Janthinobacterium sp. SUN120]